MSLPELPQGFLDYNSLQTKTIAVVVDIEGADLLTSTIIYRVPRYGDPGLNYGDAGLTYGGLVPVGSVGDRGQRSLLDISSGLVLSQRLEPEQGRAAISTLSLPFIDVGQYMTQLCSSGIIVPRILGRKVIVRLGYVQNAYPEEYFVAFRGRITSVKENAGKYVLQFSDPNSIGKGQIFYTAKTKLANPLAPGDVNIGVVSNSDFHKKILGPFSTYDTAVKCFIKISGSGGDDEWIEYQQAGSEATGFITNQFVGVLRGRRGTLATTHAAGDDVEAAVEIEEHAVDFALKLLLSKNGPWVSNVDIMNIVDSGAVVPGLVAGGVFLPQGKDAIDTYGAAIGDEITISGDPFPANNGVFQITDFQDFNGEPNRIIITNGALVASTNTPAVFSLRSQFDTLPRSCSVGLDADFVDVQGWLDLKNLFLGENDKMRPFLRAPESCKSFIESELNLPIAAYSLTRRGRLSLGYTKPPIADQDFLILDQNNVINPAGIMFEQAVNNRKFFNEIDWYFDYNDEGEPLSTTKTIDTTSFNETGELSVLPIHTKGTRTDLGFETVRQERERFFLQRYKDGALLVTIEANWEIGVQIEAGNVVGLRDDGHLKLPNWATGERNLGVRLFEVINRDWNVGQGKVKLQLLGGITGEITDRFATFGPSSIIAASSTSTTLVLTDSFGALYPGREGKKWKDYYGLKIKVRTEDYSNSFETTLIGNAGGNINVLVVSPPIGFALSGGEIVELADYSTSFDPQDQMLAKLVHGFFNPTVTVVSGSSNFAFDVAPGDVSKFRVGLPVLIRNDDFSVMSPEAIILSVIGTTITVDTDLGFTPSAGQFVELIGFSADGGTPYRFI